MSQQKEIAVFLGYEEIELSREIRGSKSIKVKCLAVRKLAEYAAMFDNECEIVALVTGLNADEVDMLSPEDSGRIFRKAHELNFAPFSQWLKRKAEALRMKKEIYQNQTSGSEQIDSSAG